MLWAVTKNNYRGEEKEKDRMLFASLKYGITTELDNSMS